MGDGRGVSLETPVVPKVATAIFVFPKIFDSRLPGWKGIGAAETEVNLEAREQAAGNVLGTHEHSKGCGVHFFKTISTNHHGKLMTSNHKRVAVKPVAPLGLRSLMYLGIVDGPHVRARPVGSNSRCFHAHRNCK